MTEKNKDFFTISKPARHEIKVKDSVFIGSLAPAVDQKTAEEYISGLRSKFHNATHNCYAYRINKDLFRYSDDGEPSSTAGKPILRALDKYCLLRSVLVVTRYFGGRKLGVGGLIQAYHLVAEETIKKADVEQVIDYYHIKIEYPYKFSRQIEYLISKYQGIISTSKFEILITSKIKIPYHHHEIFKGELQNLGGQQIYITEN